MVDLHESDLESAGRLEEIFDLQQMDKDVTEGQVDDMFD